MANHKDDHKELALKTSMKLLILMYLTLLCKSIYRGKLLQAAYLKFFFSANAHRMSILHGFVPISVTSLKSRYFWIHLNVFTA